MAIRHLRLQGLKIIMIFIEHGHGDMEENVETKMAWILILLPFCLHPSSSVL